MDIVKLGIVGFYLGLNALLLVWFVFKVVGLRRREQVSLGDGGNKHLQRVMRGHANAAETMPIFFIMLSVAALINTPGFVLHIFGALFTAGRVYHALFFVREKSGFNPRYYGMLLTLIAIGGLALGLIGHGIFVMVGG